MFLRFAFGVIFLFCVNLISAQVVINEVVSLNTLGITDEDGDYSDWIELYNTSDTSTNLEGFTLNDKLLDTLGWTFPNIELAPHSHLLVFASAKDRKNYSLNYKTIINQGDVWQYIEPSDNMPNGNWRETGFVTSGWKTGQSGFGFGDNDDQTIINSLSSIFIRKEFTINDVDALLEIILHVDYDDGFIAFINGVPVAMENVSVPNDTDYDNAFFSGSDHEAQLYSGGSPSQYRIDLSSVHLFKGTNVLALQGYNVSSSSSDFSLIPFLTLGSTTYSTSNVANFIQVNEGSLHTNFKIKNEGEGLFLFNAQNQLIDSIRIVELPANVSYGRYPDGASDWKYFYSPTPGEANLNAMDELRNDSIRFSLPAGFYSGEIQLSLSSNANNVTIKYTTDGSEPTFESKEYNGTLTLLLTTVIRAAAFYNENRSSEIFTKTYILNSEHTLPIFSITTNPDNLWDYNKGIYVAGPNAETADPHFGANYWQDWERQVHVEFFDEQKTELLDQEAGVKITGAWSRANEQKSLALFARSVYGKGSFSASLFKDLPFDKYESFMLRNSGNDWSYTMLRDGYASEIAKSLDIDRLAYQPAVLYMNGEYWGVQNLREKPNEHYFESHFGVDEDDLNLLEVQNEVVTGSSSGYIDLLSFIKSRNVATDENYNHISKLIDISCFIDYELFQIFINNTDWPGNNIKYWNSNESHSQWRWLLYDTDFGFDIWDGGAYRGNGIVFATTENGPSWPNPQWSTYLLRRLLGNANFQHQFMNRMADLLNTTFQSENMNAKLDSVMNLIQNEMPFHVARWNTWGDWDTKIGVIRRFNNNRPSYVWQHFNGYFNVNNHTVTLSVSSKDAGKIKVNSITPNSYPFTGNYFSQVPVMFTAIPNTGYKFVRWENASTSDKPAITLTLSSNIKLNAVFEPVRGDENLNIVINEINYNSTEEYNTGDWVELYNGGNQTVDLTGFVLSDANAENGYVIPPGTLLYPDGYLVISDNLNKFKSVHPKIINVVGSFSFGFSRSGDVVTVTDGENRIVDQVKYETMNPWPVIPSETAATLELKNPVYDNSLSNNWDMGPLGGTPGARNQMVTSTELLAVHSDKPTCFPTQFHDFTTLRFSSTGSKNYSVKIFDIQGRLRNELSGEFTNDGTCYLDIFTEQEKYQQGIYLIKVQTGSMIETIKVIKL